MKRYLKKVIKKCTHWLGQEEEAKRGGAHLEPHPMALRVAPYIEELISRLRHANYETYIVGGAIRDLLQGREPKDYDIATAATPEEIRNVFGRRAARIIGKRFKIVHVYVGGEIVEVSTFRRNPDMPGNKPEPLKHRKALPEKLIFDDNQFGTASEDAWRRDFSVNALFYDPLHEHLFDFTGLGLQDIQNGVVRALGDPRVRFEEDPVRLLRALKLVGQYDFTMEPATAAALADQVQLLRHASPSRLTLELEKILKSAWSDTILTACQEHGLLCYFLSFLAEHWGTPQTEYAMRLLAVRNERVRKGFYRASISIAMSALTLPFLEEYFKSEVGGLWEPGADSDERVEKMVRAVLAPHAMIKRLNASAERILTLQPRLKAGRRSSGSGAHAIEFLKIQNEAMWHSEELVTRWKAAGGKDAEEESGSESGETGAKPPRARRRRRRRKPVNTAGEALPENSGTADEREEIELPPLEVGI